MSDIVHDTEQIDRTRNEFITSSLAPVPLEGSLPSTARDILDEVPDTLADLLEYAGSAHDIVGTSQLRSLWAYSRLLIWARRNEAEWRVYVQDNKIGGESFETQVADIIQRRDPDFKRETQNTTQRAEWGNAMAWFCDPELCPFIGVDQAVKEAAQKGRIGGIAKLYREKNAKQSRTARATAAKQRKAAEKAAAEAAKQAADREKAAQTAREYAERLRAQREQHEREEAERAVVLVNALSGEAPALVPPTIVVIDEKINDPPIADEVVAEETAVGTGADEITSEKINNPPIADEVVDDEADEVVTDAHGRTEAEHEAAIERFNREKAQGIWPAWVWEEGWLGNGEPDEDDFDAFLRAPDAGGDIIGWKLNQRVRQVLEAADVKPIPDHKARAPVAVVLEVVDPDTMEVSRYPLINRDTTIADTLMVIEQYRYVKYVQKTGKVSHVKAPTPSVKKIVAEIRAVTHGGEASPVEEVTAEPDDEPVDVDAALAATQAAMEQMAMEQNVIASSEQHPTKTTMITERSTVSPVAEESSPRRRRQNA
jgi:hypothetical protein